jgi:hypothetical protein
MRSIGASVLLLFAPAALSAPITTDLNINASVSFDDSPQGSYPVDGDATQTAQLSALIGGAVSTSSVDNFTVAGSNPLGGMLSQTGDGVGFDAQVRGFDSSYIGGFFFDFDFALSNTSAIATYQIFFEIAFRNLVDADGDDSYVDAKMNLSNSDNDELWFSDLTSDSLGDQKNGVNLTTSGAEVSDNGVFEFSYTLAPGASDFFTGALTIDAEELINNGSFTAQSSAFIRVSRVETMSSNPTPVPAPTSMFLFSLGLCVLLSLKRRPLL